MRVYIQAGKNDSQPMDQTMNSIDLKSTRETDWRAMPPDERKRALFNKQKDLLDTFLSHGAIDRRQYEKSLTCMAEKMGMELNGETFDRK